MAKDLQDDSIRVHPETEYLDLFGAIWAEADAHDREHDRAASADLHVCLSRWAEADVRDSEHERKLSADLHACLSRCTPLSPSNHANQATDLYKHARRGDPHANAQLGDSGTKLLRSGRWEPKVSFTDGSFKVLVRPTVRSKHPGGRPPKEAFWRVVTAYWNRRDAEHPPPDINNRGDVATEVKAIRKGKDCVACGDVPPTTVRNAVMYCLDHPETRSKLQN